MIDTNGFFDSINTELTKQVESFMDFLEVFHVETAIISKLSIWFLDGYTSINTIIFHISRFFLFTLVCSHRRFRRARFTLYLSKCKLNFLFIISRSLSQLSPRIYNSTECFRHNSSRGRDLQ